MCMTDSWLKRQVLWVMWATYPTQKHSRYQQSHRPPMAPKLVKNRTSARLSQPYALRLSTICRRIITRMNDKIAKFMWIPKFILHFWFWTHKRSSKNRIIASRTMAAKFGPTFHAIGWQWIKRLSHCCHGNKERLGCNCFSIKHRVSRLYEVVKEQDECQWTGIDGYG